MLSEKVTKMMFPDDVFSTSFQGDTVFASFEELEKKFGVKARCEGDGKVTYEMDLEIDEIPFTIYDWEEYNVKKSDKLHLHIGARTFEESNKVRSLLISIYGL